MKDKGLVLGLLALSALIVGFYWFQLRPQQIRKDCYNKTYKVSKDQQESNKANNKEWAPGKEWLQNPLQKGITSNSPQAEWGWYYPSKGSLADDFAFRDCLIERGLETESMRLELLKKRSQ